MTNHIRAARRPTDDLAVEFRSFATCVEVFAERLANFHSSTSKKYIFVDSNGRRNLVRLLSNVPEILIRCAEEAHQIVHHILAQLRAFVQRVHRFEDTGYFRSSATGVFFVPRAVGQTLLHLGMTLVSYTNRARSTMICWRHSDGLQKNRHGWEESKFSLISSTSSSYSSRVKASVKPVFRLIDATLGAMSGSRARKNRSECMIDGEHHQLNEREHSRCISIDRRRRFRSENKMHSAGLAP